MKALVYFGPSGKVLKECPNPVIIDPPDAIVKMAKTTTGLSLRCHDGDA